MKPSKKKQKMAIKDIRVFENNKEPEFQQTKNHDWIEPRSVQNNIRYSLGGYHGLLSVLTATGHHMRKY